MGILLVLSFFLLMFGNSLMAMTHPDEVFYMQTAKEMIVHKSWLTPMIFDKPQFEKPILFYWLLIVAIKLFGLTAYAARFFPSLFGILGVGMTYWISWMLFENKRLSFLSALVLVSSFIYLALSRACLTDMVFSIFVTISIAFFYFAYRYKQHKDTGIILGFVFSAIAVLTKGLLGLTFPAAAIFFYLFYRRDLSFFKCRATILGIILFFVIALPWHLLMFQWYGKAFIDEYVVNDHLRRLVDAEHPKISTWYFYPGVMFGGVMPWSLFLIPALISIFKNIRQKVAEKDKLIFLLLWILAIFIFVQAAKSKLASYVFPVFPAMAILLGYYLNLGIKKAEEQKPLKAFLICPILMCLILLAVAVGGIYFAKKYLYIIGSMKPVYITASIAAIIAGLIVLFSHQQKYVRMIFVYALISVIVLAFPFFDKKKIEPWVSCKDVSQKLATLDSSNSMVLVSKFYVRGVRYFTDKETAVIDIGGDGFFSPHPIPYFKNEGMVLEFLKKQPVTYAVVKDDNVDDLIRITHGGAFKVEQLSGNAGKYILKITKL
ncbi:MAG: glycosyltransferase family 39 protein [Candidatus Omnitrophica bacterium]|nr:glycosyltransferase family 39 protein [Candidatus Omnitrophota bacterium]